MKLSTVEKIRILVDRQGMTLAELAEKTGQSRQNLTNKLRRENLTDSEIQKLAQALGCDSEVIFTVKDTGERL